MEEPESVVERTARLAREKARPEAEVVERPVAPVPHPKGPPTGFVDLVFHDGRLEKIIDARGFEIEIGNWIDVGTNDRLLRIVWPPSKLSDPSEDKPGAAHYKAHGTERHAAYMQRPKSGTKRAMVLGVFIADWRAGGLGLTHEEVEYKVQLGLYTTAPRCTELSIGGWIRPSGSYGRTKKNQPTIRWELTPEGIEKLNLRGRS